MAFPIDLSVNPELDPTDPDNYDGVPGEWDDEPQVYDPDEPCDCHVCTVDFHDEPFIDEFEEDFAL